jgi:hypothetical protein
MLFRAFRFFFDGSLDFSCRKTVYYTSVYFGPYTYLFLVNIMIHSSLAFREKNIYKI